MSGLGRGLCECAAEAWFSCGECGDSASPLEMLEILARSHLVPCWTLDRVSEIARETESGAGFGLQLDRLVGETKTAGTGSVSWSERAVCKARRARCLLGRRETTTIEVRKSRA